MLFLLFFLPLAEVLSVFFQVLNHASFLLALLNLILSVKSEFFVVHTFQTTKPYACGYSRTIVSFLVFVLAINLLVNLLCTLVFRVFNSSQHISDVCSSWRILNDGCTRIAKGRATSLRLQSWLACGPRSRLCWSRLRRHPKSLFAAATAVAKSASSPHWNGVRIGNHLCQEILLGS